LKEQENGYGLPLAEVFSRLPLAMMELV